MSIRSTRRGYLYQDLYAVNQFFRFYLENDLASVFVDCVYEDRGNRGQKSFDVKVVTKRHDELLYEVKTGNSFKSDKQLITAAFEDLIHTRRSGAAGSEDALMLVVSPDFLAQVPHFSANLTTIQRYQTLRTEEARTALQFFKDNIAARFFDTDEELHGHLLAIEVIYGEAIEPVQGERLCALEHHIIGQIKRLAERLGIDCPNDSVFSEEILLSQLVHAVATSAGNGVDLLAEFKRLMVAFFALYQTPTPHDISGGTGGTIDQSRRDIERRINDFENTPEIETPDAITGNAGATIAGEENE